MKVCANGREIDVPTDNQGNVEVAEVRRIANVPDNRMIIQQKPNGENIILPQYGLVRVDPYTHFMDSPRGRRGRR
jgi:hypothetical protein